MNEDEEDLDIVIEMAALPPEVLQCRGQMIAHILMIDELLDDIIAWDDAEEGEDTPLPEYVTKAEFYALLTGNMEVNPDYRDALLFVAMFGAEFTISAFCGSGKYPPMQEEQIVWPDELHLPRALVSGTFDHGKALRRDHPRDYAILSAVVLGTNVKPPHIERTRALVNLMVEVMEIAEPRAWRHLTLLIGMALWHLGDVEHGLEGLELMRGLGDLPEDDDDTGYLLAQRYRETQPEGPVWLRIQADRERSA